MGKGETQKELKERLSRERFNEVNYNFNGEYMNICKYVSWDEVYVKFQNGYIAKTQYSHFKEGTVKNLLSPSVYNKGYYGIGRYEYVNKGKLSKVYITWHSMIKRCYDEKYKEEHPTYINCLVCDEWLNFQNFAEWFDENYYEIENEKMCLDKDILVQDNKTYSPSTCVFVPERINMLFLKRDNDRGEFPIGIRRIGDKFRARANYIDKFNKLRRKELGTYKTPEDAFNLGYKPFKENYIKEFADRYKDFIPIDLYEAMYKYEIKITD
jgi:hypothetical protein